MPPGVPVVVTKRTTSVIRPAALLAGIPAVLPAEAQVYKDYGMWHETWGFGPMLFGVLMMILFWAAIFALAALLVRWIAGWGTQREQPPLKSSAVEILEERFARGEIDQQEFEDRRRVLTGQADVKRAT